MDSQIPTEKIGAGSYLEVPHIPLRGVTPSPAVSPSVLVRTLSHPGPSPELDLDRHRQATVELASTHTVILLISTLASLYLAQRVTDSVSGLFFLTLAPAVIIARLLRFRLEYLSRKDFDARFARINDRLKAENEGVTIPSYSLAPSELGGYDIGAPPTNPNTPNMTAMHAFVPHRLSPIPSIPSSYAADDGHQAPSPNGYILRPDYITNCEIPSLSSVSGILDNETPNRQSTYSLYPDSSVAGEDADPLRRINFSPLGSDVDESNGDLSRRTTASGLGAWAPAHHLSTVPSSEEITFASNPAWNRHVATPRGALNEDPTFRDSTYTDMTADFSTRAVENASLRRNGTASTNDTSIRATENGGVSRSTTASGLTGTSHGAVENVNGRFRGPLSEVVLPAKKESGDSAQTRHTWHTDMTNGTMGAVENFGGVSRAPTTSSGRTEHTYASDKAVENAGFDKGTSRMPSIGASSTLTHASNWAVDGHRSTPHSGASSPSKSPLYQPFAMDFPEVQDQTAHADVWGPNLSVQSPDSILTDRADAGHAPADDIPLRPVLLGEKVRSDDSVDTIASTDAVEDDSDGRSTQSAHSLDPVPQDFALGGLTDGVLASSVIQGDTSEPIQAESLHADQEFDGDLSSTESDGSAVSGETAGSTGSQLRRRGGIREKRHRGVKGGRWRAGSEATTHATTMDPAHGADEREKMFNTQGWAQNMQRTQQTGQLEIV